MSEIKDSINKILNGELKMKIEINKEMAIQLAETKFWETMSARDIALFQLRVRKFCMPFDIFHKAISKALGRAVYVHEFGLSWDRLLMELLGKKSIPTDEEIMNLIPREKRIVIINE